MFGYIYVNQKDLSEESKKQYQAYYCGLCQVLKKSSGVKGQILLNYDMTFLIILLTGLYELQNQEKTFICPLHPGKKKLAYINEASVYASDMNVLCPIIIWWMTGRTTILCRSMLFHRC